MINKISKNEKRKKRHARMRKKVFGTPERPRLNVYRSLNNMYAQIIDDESGTTLVSASTLDKELKAQLKNGGNKEAARLVGKAIAQKAIEKGIQRVVFDRGGYIYHGRVKELAEGAREAGLQF
ncbi:MAG TPA: 50S ribosomal protein L18 [Clostridiales bacterium]|nr:50S ribosomal protein L18 [Clostridiales bacterium]